MKYLNYLLKALQYFAGIFKVKDKPERWLFFSVLLFLLLFQIFNFSYLSAHTEILGYDSNLKKFIFKSFVNFLPEGADIRHPFLYLFWYPVILLVEASSHLFKYNNSLLIIYIYYDVLLCYAALFCYRILFEVVEISRIRSFLLTALFLSFAHVIIQAFIWESFPLSLLFLLVTVYICGSSKVIDKKIQPYLYAVLFFFTAGVTITNGVKVFLAFWFTNVRNTKLKIIWLAVMGVSFLVLIISLDFVKKKMYEKTPVSQQQQKPYANTDTLAVKQQEPEQGKVKDSTTPGGLLYKIKHMGLVNYAVAYSRLRINTAASVKENMLCEPLLFHTSDFRSVEEGRDVYLAYKHIFNYYVLLFFYLLTLMSIILSLLNPQLRNLTLLLLSFITVDALIHIFVGFGITELYIFTAHWVFVLPIIFSFLYKSNIFKRGGLWLDAILVLYILFFCLNNWNVIFNFVSGKFIFV